MPELPEVQTTVTGLNKTIVGLTISDAWSDYNSSFFKGSETIKDPTYFKKFKKEIIGKKVISASRRAKNILIHIGPARSSRHGQQSTAKADSTILIHMKMTGHIMYGTYHFNATKKKDPWEPIAPESLKDPFNRHIHFMLSFTNGKQLALSDVRKFAKVTLIKAGDNDHIEDHIEKIHTSSHLKDIGPEPLEPAFTFTKFVERLNMRPQGKIKQVLMDQMIMAGVGNIYADESLWRASIHPLEQVKAVPAEKLRALYTAIRKTLSRGIDFGGDSTSDYRNVFGERGEFHEHHRAYQRTGEKCDKPGCGGTIKRIVLGSRGTHFCDRHQKLSRT